MSAFGPKRTCVLPAQRFGRGFWITLGALMKPLMDAQAELIVNKPENQF